MTINIRRHALVVIAIGALVSVPMLSAQPSYEIHVKKAIAHANEAVDHGKQGHADVLVTHAQSSLNHAKLGGENPHLVEAIKHLNEAIEHGKAGHADVATGHAENAITHLSEAPHE